MPTTRPRHQVTETPQVGDALDLASRRWPGESRSRLLIRLIEVGRDALAAELSPVDLARREAIERSGWAFAEIYSSDYLSELREDWE